MFLSLSETLIRISSSIIFEINYAYLYLFDYFILSFTDFTFHEVKTIYILFTVACPVSVI